MKESDLLLKIKIRNYIKLIFSELTKWNISKFSFVFIFRKSPPQVERANWPNLAKILTFASCKKQSSTVREILDFKTGLLSGKYPFSIKKIGTK